MGKYDFDFTPEMIEKKKAIFVKKAPGKRAPFYNGCQRWEFDKDDTQLFYNAVWQGYLDAARTFVKVRDTKTKNQAFRNLANSIQLYFSKDMEFEHARWRRVFICDIEKYNTITITPGQAQKVINMAFKYLYCCEGSISYDEKFVMCHVPVDGLVLKWLSSMNHKAYLEWSKLYDKDYEEIQKDIKNILGDDCLAKEFVIWDEMRNLTKANCNITY